MKWFWAQKKEISSPSDQKKGKADTGSVARSALKQYDKTFKDLARHDRGEKVLNTVSR